MLYAVIIYGVFAMAIACITPLIGVHVLQVRHHVILYVI